MIGEILGGVSALASLFGSIKSAQANNAMDSKLASQRSELQTWYDKEYNQNYLDTPEAKSTLQILKNQSAEQMKKIDQNNAITGASDERRVATADKLNRGMANATTKLAGYGTRKQEYAGRMYQSLLQNQNQMELANMQNKAQNWTNFGNNAMNAGIGFAQAGGDGAFDKWDTSLTNMWKRGKSKRIGNAIAGTGINIG